jgi:uncharacterized protein Yka (UPF0111/DUF47 family)
VFILSGEQFGEFMLKKLLKKLLPPEEKIFFELFSNSANACNEAAKVYCEITVKGLNEENLQKAKDLRKTSNRIARQTLRKLNETFITPIDREDIQDITSLLNKITKRIVKACFNMKVYRIKKADEYMQCQADILAKATEELIYIVSLLQKVANIKDATLSNQKLKTLESEGDDILYKALDDLYSGKYDAIDIIKFREIYKDIESALDSCCSVADEIVSVMLKHN